MKINLIKLTLNQLLISGTHLGDIKKLLNGKMKSYLLGFKGKLNIFDIKYSHLQLKMVLYSISNLVALRQQILLINHHYDSMKLPTMSGIQKFCFFLEGH
jgi:ribosomal protein S2